MTVKQSPMANVMDSIRKGATSFGRTKEKDKVDQGHDEDRTVDLGDANLGDGRHSANPEALRREPRASLDDMDDMDDIVEAEFIETQSAQKLSMGERFNGLSKGKKAVLVAIVVAGALVLKNQVDAPNTDPHVKVEATNKPELSTAGSHDFQSQQGLGNTHEPIELPQTELGKLSASAPGIPPKAGAATAIGFDTNESLELGTPVTADNINAGQDAHDSDSFSLNGPFGDGLLKSESQQTLDSQAQLAKSENLSTNPQNAVVSGQIQASASAAPTSQVKPQTAEVNTMAAAQQQNHVPGASSQIQPPQVTPNPFDKAVAETKPDPAGFDTRFGGTDSPKLDSGKPVLGKADASANVATLKAELDAQDRKLADVDGRLKQAEAKLAGTQQKPATQPHSRPVAKPVRHVASAAKAPSHNKVANASPVKVLPRPKLCVAAVAEPARNCSTCVAHAFITNRGQDTMVGQGDYIEGYRVSIQGDRLDLQDDKGVVAHKFWSSPDGCRSI